MGIGSSLLQFVESLRQDLQQDPRVERRSEPPGEAPGSAEERAGAPDRPAPSVTAAPRAVAAVADRRLAVLAEIERALNGSRQRLEVVAARLEELRARAGIAGGPSARPPSSP